MSSFLRPTLIAVALLVLSCGAAVAQTTTHASGVSARAAHSAHLADAVRCKNPAECSVPR
jgi:hypothetical protein